MALPFRSELSLAPLINFWTQASAYSEFGRGPLPGIIREKVREALLAGQRVDGFVLSNAAPSLVLKVK